MPNQDQEVISDALFKVSGTQMVPLTKTVFMRTAIGDQYIIAFSEHNEAKVGIINSDYSWEEMPIRSADYDIRRDLYQALKGEPMDYHVEVPVTEFMAQVLLAEQHLESRLNTIKRMRE